MSVTAILFDLDGTLHDRASGIVMFAADQFSRLGQRPDQLPLYVERFLKLDANGRADLQKALITLLGFDAVVDAVVISEEAGYRKPDQISFDLALRQLGAEADETLMVGGDPVADIASATDAGLHFIAFRCPVVVDVLKSVTTMAEVLQVVDRMPCT